MQKGNYKGEKHNELPRDPLGGRSSLSSPHQSSPMQLHCIRHSSPNTGAIDRWGKNAVEFTTTGNSENMSVTMGYQFI
jgi:hypothetical protein